MAVLCPRCGEYSSILDEHCKKCGFSIKNYLENRKRFGNVEVQATDNGSSSVCVKEETTASNDNDKSDEIQENIMRLLKNVKIVPDENKVEENEKIESNVQSVLESALKESFQDNNEEIKRDSIQKETLKKEAVKKDSVKKEAVKIVAKKVANDVIILPPNRVKVEIEASKDVVRKADSKVIEDSNINKEKLTVEDKKIQKENVEAQIDKKIEKENAEAQIDKKVQKENVEARLDKDIDKNTDKNLDKDIENKIEEIKKEIVAEREAARKEEIVDTKVESKEKEAIAKAELKEEKAVVKEKAVFTNLEDRIKREDDKKDSLDDITSTDSMNKSYNFSNSEEDIERFNNYSDGALFNNFIEESRKNDETKKMVAMIGGFLVLIIFVVIFVTNSAIIGIF